MKKHLFSSFRSTPLLAVGTMASLVLHLGATAAAGATCTVNAAGGAQFSTIQAAVDNTTCTQINVAAGTYNEHVSIARDVTITGAGAGSTIVDGTNNGRVFTINSGVVVLNDLTVQHGKTADGNSPDPRFNPDPIVGDGEPGAGILNKGALTIARVIVKDNQTGKGGSPGQFCFDPFFCDLSGGNGGDGAGISSKGTLTINASTFIGNATGVGGAPGMCYGDPNCREREGDRGIGGAIAFANGSGAGTIATSSFSNNSGYDGGAINQNNALLTISDSQFTGNAAGDAGGAVNCDSGQQACTIQGSTFASNTVTGRYGGGAISFFNDATKTVTNCTIANNASTDVGGGIYAFSGPVNLNFVTIVGNRSDSDNDGYGDGGGLNNRAATFTVKNSLIAANTKGTSTAQNCAGGLSDSGYNLDSAATCGFTAATSQSNTNPLLDSAGLADHGGPTQTIALQATSPAIDKANSAGGPQTDQRGFLRPVDLGTYANATGGNGADIGAFEVQARVPIAVVSRKLHNSVPYDISLPLYGTPGVECRSGGASNVYQLVFSFPTPITYGSATVTSGIGSVTNSTGTGTSTVTVNLSGVTNAQKITITLASVTDASGSNNAAVTMGVLIGDANGDRAINSGDATITRNHSGQTADATNFRSDYNLDGFINSADATIVRARSGQFIPGASVGIDGAVLETKQSEASSQGR